LNKIILIFIILFGNLPLKAVDIDTLIQKARYNNAKISPDGKHLAVQVYDGEKLGLYFLKTNTLERVGSFFLSRKDQVGDYFWGNNERVVIKLVRSHPWVKELSYYGELFAVNFDGSKAKLIYGYRVGKNNLTRADAHKNQSINGWAYLIDRLPDEPKNILIASNQKLTKPLKIDIYNGRIRKRYPSIPLRQAQVLSNSQGQPIIASTMDKEENRHAFKFDIAENEWVEIPSNLIGSSFQPILITEDQKSVIVLDDKDQDKIGLFQFDLASFKYTSIYTNNDVNITSFQTTSDSKSVQSIRIDNGLPEYLLLASKNSEAALFKSFLAKFPGYKVAITSSTKDGNKLIVKISSDTTKGVFLLYDKQADTHTFLFNKAPLLDKYPLAKTTPISFKSQDNKTIHGYFTKALKKTKENIIAPMVVLVHGGPHGVRDYWGFDTEVQALATNGFSVLQINFRGSAGYGFIFKESGYKQWGNNIQQDIIDGTHWAIENKLVHKGNICIMGASFGAYSAVQSAILKPSLYQCVVAASGVYDMNLMDSEGDIKEVYFADSFLKRVIGTNKKVLASISPVNYIEKLKANLLLVHGEKDKRAPIIHAEKLIDAMKKHAIKYEWMKVDDEAHGFYDEINRAIYLKKVLRFLNENLSL